MRPEVDDPLRFRARPCRVYRAIRSFSEQSVKQSSFLGRLRSLALFFDNTYTLLFKIGRSAAVLRRLPSRVSRDSFVFRGKCETVVTLRSLEVALPATVF